MAYVDKLAERTVSISYSSTRLVDRSVDAEAMKAKSANEVVRPFYTLSIALRGVLLWKISWWGYGKTFIFTLFDNESENA